MEQARYCACCRFCTCLTLISACWAPLRQLCLNDQELRFVHRDEALAQLCQATSLRMQDHTVDRKRSNHLIALAAPKGGGKSRCLESLGAPPMSTVTGAPAEALSRLHECQRLCITFNDMTPIERLDEARLNIGMEIACRLLFR